jgi:hypothetical protein
MAQSSATEILSHLRALDHDVWGLTVVRTAYGGDTERQWAEIISSIQAGIQREMDSLDRGEPGDLDKLRAAFRLDIRSDAETLDGASMAAVRKLCKDDPTIWLEVALLVDEETMSAARSRQNHWIKVVEIDYNEARHRGHIRMPQHYWGWMKASTQDLIYLWWELVMMYREPSRVAPATILGMVLAVWPDDSSHVWYLRWREIQRTKPNIWAQLKALEEEYLCRG